ncbi:MAG: hypothetical protein KJP21_09260 [Bacteroidia bacterium]|nr:hypothetical protein [Bacteroidia bacterium]NNJ55499.1 hypothetical protein [Bacteroidia bacterium]
MKHFLTLVILFCVCLAYAQNERDLPKADDNFHKYLDDGKKNDADADIKLALSALPAGYLDIQYEQKLTPSWSVLGSGAFQIFDGVDLGTGWDDLSSLGEFKTGFGFGVEGRRYGAYAAITDLGYWSINYRNRMTLYEDANLGRHDIYFSRGNKYLFLNTISAEVSYGLGARFYKYNVDEEKNKIDEDFSGISPHYNLEFKLGYYIKY